MQAHSRGKSDRDRRLTENEHELHTTLYTQIGLAGLPRVYEI